ARASLEGTWGTMDARDRGRLMYKLADLMEENIDYLAALESYDNGKPFAMSKGADLPLAIDCIRYYAGYADKIHGSTIPVRGNFLTYTRKEPVGVVGQIIPWNFPILMAAWKWGPALAAGCAIVMKPAEQTPLTCLYLGHLAQKAGFPDGSINILPGFGAAPAAGGAIVNHPGVDKVAFTGETTTGKLIMKEAANTLKRVTFELGGKSPNIIFSDANMESAIAGAYAGLYFNQGQCCTAGSRVFVEETIYDQFVDQIRQINESCKVGNPFDPTTQQGSQIDKTQFDKIMQYIEIGKSEGAHCLTGGARHGEQGYFIEPTLFTEVDDSMKIATDEIFGPVMTVIKFKDEEDIIRRANDSPYGLAGGVWSQDINKANRVAHAIKAGTIWVNCYHIYDAAAPFGGFKMSGLGRELGEEGLRPYLETKTVTVSLG
ncbi:MAG: aldehyde dehydrogenase family protein, partial [Pirellulaceae bacterium]|nr:aldehyde dehydrogenase family protein [Pirellulaceae bacterium]